MVGTHLSVNLIISGFCVEKDTYSRCGGTFPRVEWTSREPGIIWMCRNHPYIQPLASVPSPLRATNYIPFSSSVLTGIRTYQGRKRVLVSLIVLVAQAIFDT